MNSRRIAVSVCASAVYAIRPVSAQDRFFSSNGVRIHYVERGTGELVVLLHGFAGSAAGHWISTGIVDSLAGQYRVVAMDLRGHGESEKPHDTSAYGRELGNDVIRLLDHLAVRRAHLVGYSLGAIIAGQVAAENPDRFSTVTLIGEGISHSWSPRDDSIVDAGARELESDVPFRSLALAIAPRGAPPPSEAEIRALSSRVAASNDARALAALFRAQRAFVTADTVLRKLRLPVSGIAGSLDRNLPSMNGLSELLPNYAMSIIEGATHGGSTGVLRNAKFARELRESLEKKTATRPQ
jgi:pimeloyl-ACP methyl ester carboxylesterase